MDGWMLVYYYFFYYYYYYYFYYFYIYCSFEAECRQSYVTARLDQEEEIR
jgi:hypothetical protein